MFWSAIFQQKAPLNSIKTINFPTDKSLSNAMKISCPHFLPGTQNGHEKEMKYNEINKGEIMEEKIRR
jgi:hypothetical protein